VIKVESLTFNAFAENTYILSDETLEAIVIDPGCSNTAERQHLTSFIEANGYKVVKLLNTHAHIDHILGNAFVKDTYKVPYYLHKNDMVMLERADGVALSYGFRGYVGAAPDGFIDENDTITFGNSTLSILFVPGHAPGHLAFINLEQKICISGDVLFKRSIGRTDFPHCNHQDLIDSINNKMFALPDDMIVYSGHGDTTTIGYEKRWNPYVGQNMM
jgi:hydroxyacylglutathione hydrolase